MGRRVWRLENAIAFVVRYIGMVHMDRLGMRRLLPHTDGGPTHEGSRCASGDPSGADRRDHSGSRHQRGPLAAGIIWLLLGLAGTARRVATWVPRFVVVGIILGLGIAFIIEGVKMMVTG